VLPVKENRRALFDALDTLAWKDVPLAPRSIDKSHGRVTTRTIQVLPAPPDLPFPHVNQVFLIEQYVSDLRGQPISAIAALGVASLKPDQTDPANLASYVREQWSIESLHWIRDTLYHEDKSQIKSPIRAQNHGHTAHSRHRRPPTGRTHRHHRSHPMGRTLHEPAPSRSSDSRHDLGTAVSCSPRAVSGCPQLNDLTSYVRATGELIVATQHAWFAAVIDIPNHGRPVA
jgi:hypothetical protein